MERTPFTVLVERLEHAFSLALRKLAADLAKGGNRLNETAVFYFKFAFKAREMYSK